MFLSAIDPARNLPAWNAALFGGAGLLLVFAGYRSMRLTARVVGALIFAVIGLVLGSYFQKPWVQIVSAALLGGVGYMAGDLFYYVKMALNGAVAGGVLVAAVFAALRKEAPGLALGAGMAAGGVLALLFERPIGIFGTSVIGAGLSTLALGSLAPGGGLALLAFPALVLVGCWTQAVTTRKLPPKGESPKPAPRPIG
jgi:hypothetical protein